MIEVVISTNSKEAEDYVSSIQRRLHDMNLLLVEDGDKNRAMDAAMREVFMCPEGIINLVDVEFKEIK